MGRPATGQVICDTRRKQPVYGLRFRAYGQRRYLTLGTAAEGWTRQKAETELQNVMADVRRGMWQPPTPAPVADPPSDPTFHEFASTWYEANKGSWRQNTRLDYGWQLSSHLLPFFKDHRLSQITIAEVDRYRQAKVTEARTAAAASARGKPLIDEYTDRQGRTHHRPRRPLSATSINKTLTRLGQILDVAVEYGLIDSNPAKGRKRRLKTHKSAPVWLDRAEHIGALLDAARVLDRHASEKGGHDHKGGIAYRRALLATLVFAGLRIGESTALRWRDVDLAANRITVGSSKTDAGLRQVDILPTLRDELAAHKAQAACAAPDAYVFATMAGTRPSQGNIRRRVLDRAIEAANQRLTAAGEVPLPEGLTPHKLRHTFASILVALGVDPGSVMDQLGHADPGFTLRVYRHGMRRDAASKRALQELVGLPDEPHFWAAMGSSTAQPSWGGLTTGGLPLKHPA